MMDVQSLPPKMAAKFAQDAKDGKATRSLGNQFYEFDNGSNIVVLVSLDPPSGYTRRKTPAEKRKD